MHRRLLHVALACFALAVAAPDGSYCQKSGRPGKGEVVAEVPALTEFHTVIFKIWHTAWPKRDAAMLAGLVPEVRMKADAVARAGLPGILRDKKARWEENVAKLQDIVKEYEKYSSPVDTQKLLDAAEQLHAQYERLVRSIHPVLTEMEEFHAVLYQLYHYDMPASDLTKIRSSVSALRLKMDALDKATLPERLKGLSGKFASERSSLAEAVRDLDKALGSKDKKLIRGKIEVMHSNYQRLEKVFE
jgi:hypothetical protein